MTGLAAAAVLVALHLTVVSRFLATGENLVFFLANVVAVGYGLLYHRAYGPLRFGLYLTGYLAFFIAIAHSPASAPLLSLFIVLYASLFRLPRWLMHFLLFVLAVELLAEYFVMVFLLAALLLELIHHALTVSHERFLGWSFLVGFILIGGLLLPVLGLVLGSSPQTLLATARDEQVISALGTSLLTATVTTLVALVLGVPLAYAMARTDFWGRRVLQSLVDLPILIPQTVAGVALLLAIGPKTTIGLFLQDSFGLRVTGTLTAIVLAQLFVSAPFLIRTAVAAFEDVDPRLEHVSRTLGASPLRTFRSVSLPQAAPGILAGCILTWSRALSEAGAVMLVAYQPYTISTLVNDRFNQYGTEEAAPVAALLVIVCLFVFLALNLLRAAPVLRLGDRTGGR